MPELYGSLLELKRGKNGEEAGIKYLQNNGFEIIETNENNMACPYDVLAKKDNNVFAINIKSAKTHIRTYR